MRDQADNPSNIKLPAPPMELIVLRYRQHFNLDYWQCFYTPYHVMVKDLEILSIESEIKDSYRSAKSKAKSGTIK